MAFKEYKGLDLSKVADEVLSDWEKNKSFEKSISIRRDAPKFIFYEGPPSANGMPGIHHVMARSIKDIFCRFKTLKGFQVERKAGWDTHGLPIELSVEKDLRITKEDIGTKISVEDYNKACKKAVMKYTDVWNDLTKKMGYWVDMSNPYITYESKYIESVWWLLKELYNKNLPKYVAEAPKIINTIEKPIVNKNIGNKFILFFSSNSSNLLPVMKAI